MSSVPEVSSICTVRSSRLRKEKPVFGARWIDADPSSTSAREFWSAQSRSPIVIGRFGTACTHSDSPAGSKDTDPCIYPSRATRPGGSSYWSCATAERENAAIDSTVAARKNLNARRLLAILGNQLKFIVMLIPLNSGMAVRLFLCARSESTSATVGA